MSSARGKLAQSIARIIFSERFQIGCSTENRLFTSIHPPLLSSIPSTYSASRLYSNKPHIDANDSDIQSQLLSVAMQHIKTLGWSRAALEAAAHELGLSPAIIGSFPGREGALIQAFNAECNHRLSTELDSRKEELSDLPLKDRLALCIKLRLQMIVENNTPEKWGEALAVYARDPVHNLAHSFDNYSQIADIIWRSCGDVSSDFNWYTKRMALGGVYVTTELALVTDTSPGYEETWKFLYRRLDDTLPLIK